MEKPKPNDTLIPFVGGGMEKTREPKRFHAGKMTNYVVDGLEGKGRGHSWF